jgi:hypothetical protein
MLVRQDTTAQYRCQLTDSLGTSCSWRLCDHQHDASRASEAAPDVDAVDLGAGAFVGGLPIVRRVRRRHQRLQLADVYPVLLQV